jgi:hypothetical protein
MITKKIIISILAIYLLNGCVQNTALLGPAVTVASTGNVYQAGLSYGSSKALAKITGRTAKENIKNFTNLKKKKSKEEENYDEFFMLVKNRIEETRKIINSSNQ